MPTKLKTEPASVAPVVHALLTRSEERDEIDVGRLCDDLARQWKLIAATTAGGTALMALLAFTATPEYRQQVTVSLPSVTAIERINAETLQPTDRHAVFRRYYDGLRSPEAFRSFATDAGYVERLFPQSGRDLDEALTNLLWRALDIVIDEPAPATRGAQVTNPERVTLSLQHNDEPAIAAFLNDYLLVVQAGLRERMQREMRASIDSELALVERGIELMRTRARRERQLEIERIESVNAEKSRLLGNQIAALLNSAQRGNEHTIVQVIEARQLAANLGIDDPTFLDELKPREATPRTEITLADRQELPLYLMGTRYLDAYVDKLRGRESAEPYVPQVTELRRELELVNNDARLTALRTRESDDPFIEGLPDLLARRDQLSALDPDLASIDLYTLERGARTTGEKIKPRRALMLAAGFAASLVLGLLIAYIVSARRHRHDAPSALPN